MSILKDGGFAHSDRICAGEQGWPSAPLAQNLICWPSVSKCKYFTTWNQVLFEIHNLNVKVQ